MSKEAPINQNKFERYFNQKQYMDIWTFLGYGFEKDNFKCLKQSGKFEQ